MWLGKDCRLPCISGEYGVFSVGLAGFCAPPLEASFSPSNFDQESCAPLGDSRQTSALVSLIPPILFLPEGVVCHYMSLTCDWADGSFTGSTARSQEGPCSASAVGWDSAAKGFVRR